MLAKQRARAILKQLSQQRTVSATNLCQIAGASEATTLEEEGFLVRESDLAAKQRCSKEKERIARYAANLAGEDDAVYLDCPEVIAV